MSKSELRLKFAGTMLAYLLGCVLMMLAILVLSAVTDGIKQEQQTHHVPGIYPTKFLP